MVGISSGTARHSAAGDDLREGAGVLTVPGVAPARAIASLALGRKADVVDRVHRDAPLLREAEGPATDLAGDLLDDVAELLLALEHVERVAVRAMQEVIRLRG